MFRSLVLILLVASAFAYPNFGRKHRLSLDGRIIGGSVISINDEPHIGSLQWRNSHICGGSLITPQTVITAAHCTIGASASLLGVRTGSTNHGSGGTVSSVSRFILHPNYNDNNLDSDISLVFLSSPVTLGATRRVISFPAQGVTPPTGATVLTSGWGYTREGGSLSPNLQRVSINIISPASCASSYSGFNTITPRMVCAGVAQGGRDACQGDSGGPLTLSGSLIGLTSWGRGCARAGSPGVWTNVAQFTTWINNNRVG